MSQQFVAAVARCRKAFGDDTLPVIRLHDLRHTHATILILAREPVNVVSQRLGHSSPAGGQRSRRLGRAAGRAMDATGQAAAEGKLPVGAAQNQQVRHFPGKGK